MIHLYELKAKDVHAYTLKVLKEHLNIEANGYCCQTDMILDKGFVSTAIVNFLTSQKQPATLPIRSAASKVARAPCVADAPATKPGTPSQMAMKASLVPDHTGKRHRKCLSFIVILLDRSVDKTHPEYRQRFGMECSYRLWRRLRATTTSRNPVLRFFLLSVGLILVNARVFLRWEFARRTARGPRRVEEPRFRLQPFSRFLIRTIEMLYGTISPIPTVLSLQSVIY